MQPAVYSLKGWFRGPLELEQAKLKERKGFDESPERGGSDSGKPKDPQAGQEKESLHRQEMIKENIGAEGMVNK